MVNAATIGWLRRAHTARSVPRGDLRDPADSDHPVMADEIHGPHRLPQPDQQRSAAGGRRAAIQAEGITLEHGGATLLAIRWDRGAGLTGWVFYLDTDPRRAIFIADGELAGFIQTIANTR